MALRWARSVTVATTGPRSSGSVAPQTMGRGLGPCPPGWEVSTILAALRRGGVVGEDKRGSSGHPAGVALEGPLGGDLLEATPELHRRAAGDVAVTELRLLGTSEGEWLAR